MSRSVAPDDPAGEGSTATEDFHQLERVYAREERWEDLAGVLIERAGEGEDEVERARALMRAAMVFEEKLGDPDRAFITMLAALQECPSDEDLANDVARLARARDRWTDVLAECNGFAAEAQGGKRADMLVAISRWYRDELDDGPAAEHALEQALAANPANRTALRALVDSHSQRGDWVRAAAYLTSAADNTSDASQRVALALEAADIYRSKLDDVDGAAEQYRRVVQANPEHPLATEALLAIAWERQDWATALPLLERMAGNAEPRSSEESARLHQRAGWAAQMLGDVERARELYRRANARDGRYLPALLCWAELALREDWPEDMLQVVPLVLERAEAPLTTSERVEYLQGLGQAHMAGGNPAAAAEALGRALELAPDDRATRRLLSKAHGKLQGQGVGAASRIEQQRLLLKGAASDDERFDILGEIGRIQREELNDHEGALATFLEALDLRPGDPETLHELMEIYTLTGQWQHAVEVVRALVETESGKARARYLVAAANILHYELASGLEAVELYNQALDLDPEDRRSFERIERILTQRAAWRDLTRNYRHMIKRLGASPPPAQRPLLLALWGGLATLCRTRLGDFEAAAAAYEVCASLAADDRSHREAQAEALEQHGPASFAKAVKVREQLLATAGSPGAVAKQIRALARLHGSSRAYDRAFCASAAMVALLKADAHERAFYERNAVPGVPLAGSALTEAMWQRCVCDAGEDRRLSALFAAVSSAVALARAKEPSALGIDLGSRVDLSRDQSSVSQILVYASRLTGVPLPAVYVPHAAAGEMDLVTVREGQQVAASFILGRDLVAGRTEAELAFVLARKLVGLRGEYFVLWPQLVPSPEELRVILAAAIRLVHAGFELPGTDPVAVRKYSVSLQRLLQPAQISALAPLVRPLLSGPAIDLPAWIAAAARTKDRAGLVACGNVVAAARELVKEARQRGTAPADAILSLARWSASSDYMDLRAQLGLALVPSPEDLGTAPACLGAR